MCVHTSYQLYGYPPFTWTHNIVFDNFVTIAWDVSFRMGQEQLHALPSNMFNPSRRQVDIVLTKNGIRTLIDDVITDLIRTYLFPRSCVT